MFQKAQILSGNEVTAGQIRGQQEELLTSRNF